MYRTTPIINIIEASQMPYFQVCRIQVCFGSIYDMIKQSTELVVLMEIQMEIIISPKMYLRSSAALICPETLAIFDLGNDLPPLYWMKTNAYTSETMPNTTVLVENSLESHLLSFLSRNCSLTHLPLVPHINALLNWVSTVSDNGLSPERRQIIIWTSADILSFRP